MEPREAIIHAVLVKHADSSVLDNPAVGYGLAGAGLGAGASLFKTLLQRPDQRSGAMKRLLTSMAIGGGAGAALGVGSQLMGKSLPSVREVVQPGSTKSSPASEAVGVGLLGTGAVGGLSALQKRRIMKQHAANDLSSTGEIQSLAEKALSFKLRNKGKAKLTPEQTSVNAALAKVQSAARSGGFSAAKQQMADESAKAGSGSIAKVMEFLKSNAGKETGAKAVDADTLARLTARGKGLKRLGLIGAGIGGGHYLLNSLVN